VPVLVKIDDEMRPRECSQTDTYTDRLTNANRFYNLSHAICYSYGTWLTCSTYGISRVGGHVASGGRDGHHGQQPGCCRRT